jgi:hypothetical protein
MKQILITTIAAMLLVGCVTTITQSVPYNDADFEKYAGTGTSNITGSAFLKTRGGDVKVGAGSTVELIPSTPYTYERFAPQNTNVNFGPRDFRLAKHIRTALGDAQGNFEFTGIPAGDYILACSIEWQYASGSYASTTGGQVVTRVSVKAGETKKVVLTR